MYNTVIKKFNLLATAPKSVHQNMHTHFNFTVQEQGTSGNMELVASFSTDGLLYYNRFKHILRMWLSDKYFHFLFPPPQPLLNA
jgi:hypothetical protein